MLHVTIHIRNVKREICDLFLYQMVVLRQQTIKGIDDDDDDELKLNVSSMARPQMLLVVCV